MRGTKKFTWLISPKSFIQLIGAEYDILRRSGSGSVVRFYIAAVFIVMILLLSWLSIFYATELLFHSYLLEVFLSVFISLLFVFIYIFLINTFSKPIFKRLKTSTSGRLITLSNIIRIGFVIFMAFLISKPVEIFIYKKQLNTQIESYRKHVLGEYTASLKKLNEKDISRLSTQREFLENLVNKDPTGLIRQDINNLSGRIAQIQQAERADLGKAEQRTLRSNYLLQRVKLASRKPIAWLICLGLVCLFLSPGYLIYSISANDAYYELKKKSEIKLVMEEFRAFEKMYSAIFLESYGIKLSYYSKYEDPPLNTRLKPTPAFGTQQDFLKQYSLDDPNGL